MAKVDKKKAHYKKTTGKSVKKNVSKKWEKEATQKAKSVVPRPPTFKDDIVAKMVTFWELRERPVVKVITTLDDTFGNTRTLFDNPPGKQGWK
mmetsp:Transcript_6315/g.11215  ORF Transcript_6315/g.11215 Transcript_6315/m.11215 type:complete len:93 (-) Transcript_6315:44-322(-)